MSGPSSSIREAPSSSSGRTEWSSDAAFRGADPGASTCDAMPPGEFPSVDGAVGRTLGDYIILDKLGSGGMGAVYRAIHKSLQKPVALKLIKAEWWGDSTAGEDQRAEARFRNEAQALGQLEHDHIVPIYDAGRIDGVVYFSMRLIRGPSLAGLLRKDGPMEPRQAAAYIEPIARAVQYAHDRKIVHRDLKPSNIMVDADGRPCLIDLGLCKSLEATDTTSTAGRPLGTAEYMAPEQARGDRQVGTSVDIYGLGATLMTLLTGQPPFGTGPAAAVLRRVIHDEPRWPHHRDRAVPRELKAICLKCLEKHPSQRFESAGAVAVALRRYLDGEPTGVVECSRWQRAVRWVRRSPWRAAAAGLAIVTVLLAAVFAIRLDHRDRELASAFARDLPATSWKNLDRRIREMPARARDLLHAPLADEALDPEVRTRLLLALLPSEPSRSVELVDRLLECAPDEHRAIVEGLRPHRAAAAARLRAAMEAEGSTSERRTRAAAALINLDGAGSHEAIAEAVPAWAILGAVDDPDRRVELMDWLVGSRIDPRILVDRINIESNPAVRRALIQVLAERDDAGRPPAEIEPGRIDRLEVLYRDDPDPGVHGSLAYLLRRWGRGSDRKRIDADLAGRPPGGRGWLVDAFGQTLAIIGPVAPEPGAKTRRLAVATTEVTLAAYLQFEPDFLARVEPYHGELPRDEGSPACAVSFVRAARFCNWLSERAGLPKTEWCYQAGPSPGSMVLVPDYARRRGYRLPTLAEWEFAARAGTTTDRYFGRSARSAGSYAWYNRNTENHAEPVGRLRPNDFGLFDVLGNLVEWCDNRNPPHSEKCDCPAGSGSECREYRLASIRGGSFNQPEGCLTVTRIDPSLDFQVPSLTWRCSGFRVVQAAP